MENKINRIAFDIGAYTGDTTDKLLQVYDKVICVDANPNMVNLLRKKYTEAPVEIIEGCISDSKTEESFYISTHDDWCSSKREIAERLEIAKEEVACADQYDYILINDTVEATVRRLGQIIHGNRYSRNSMKSFLKSYIESEIHSEFVDVIRSL